MKIAIEFLRFKLILITMSLDELVAKEEVQNAILRVQTHIDESQILQTITHEQGSSRMYIQQEAAYQALPNERYTPPKIYSLRNLRPVQVGTREGLGFSEGLGGLNYTDLGHRFARWDWIHAPADEVITHEIRHDGTLFKGHNLAEYWNRIMDSAIRPTEKFVAAHAPKYMEWQYRF